PHDARRIIAYAATDLDPAALARQIAPLLPPIAHPAQIIPLDAIPTTPNGKRDPAKLPDPDSVAATTHAPPQTHADRQLALIWKQVLGITNVGANDNFFAIGGDSLRALRVVALARKAGMNWVTPASLFARPVLRALATEASSAGLARNLVALNSDT